MDFLQHLLVIFLVILLSLQYSGCLSGMELALHCIKIFGAFSSFTISLKKVDIHYLFYIPKLLPKFALLQILNKRLLIDNVTTFPKLHTDIANMTDCRFNEF